MALMPTRPRVFEPAHPIDDAVTNDAVLETLEPETESEPEPEPTVNGWRLMATAPQNRSIYLTPDPENDTAGLLSFWRTTRHKVSGVRGWQVRSFWASVLSRREVEFDPAGWREANGLPILS